MEDFQVNMISHLSHTLPFAFVAYIALQNRHLLYTIDLPALGAPIPKWTVLKQEMQRCLLQLTHVWYSSPFLHISQVAKRSRSICYLFRTYIAVFFYHCDSVAHIEMGFHGSKASACRAMFRLFLLGAVNKRLERYERFYHALFTGSRKMRLPAIRQ